jgi:uncharacterized protein YbcI
MVQILSQYTGRGPTRARTALNTNFVLVIMDETLTRAEQNLVAAGQADAVVEQRRVFQQVIRSEAVAVVEEATGRTVRAHLSDMSPEANVSVEVFLLEPLPETGRVEVADAEMPPDM